MFRYQTIKPLGDGAYGTVHTALNKATGEVVAVKKMKAKYSSWEECMQLREVKALRKLCHPNIVRLREVVRESDELNLIFELLDQNLLTVLKEKRGLLKEARIRSIMSQIISGVAYVHHCGFFHRDIKPENVLLRGETVKLCDFGLAREIHSRPPYTEYVSTRWYRAPEILLRSTHYGCPVDVWAIGTLMAELVTGRPLFPGSSEVDTLSKITTVLGTPSLTTWPEGHALASRAHFRFPNARGIPLTRLLRQASLSMLQVIRATLTFDPARRPRAEALLRFPFFLEGMPVAATKTSDVALEWPDTPPLVAPQKQPQMSPAAWGGLAVQMEPSGGSDSAATPVSGKSPPLGLESELNGMHLERCEHISSELSGSRLDSVLERERMAMRAAHLRQVSAQDGGAIIQSPWRRRRRKRDETSPPTSDSPVGAAPLFAGDGTKLEVQVADDSEGGDGFVGAYRPSFGRADSEPNLLLLRPVGEFGIHELHEDQAKFDRAPASPSLPLGGAVAASRLKAPAPKRAASAAAFGGGGLDMDVDVLNSAGSEEQPVVGAIEVEPLPAFPTPLGTFGPSAPTLALRRHRRSSSQPTTGWRFG